MLLYRECSEQYKITNHKKILKPKTQHTHYVRACVIILHVSNFMTFIPVIPTTTPTAVHTDQTSAISIGVTRNNTEDRYHTNNTYFPFISCLIIGATSSKGDGGYEFEWSLSLLTVEATKLFLSGLLIVAARAEATKRFPALRSGDGGAFAMGNTRTAAGVRAGAGPSECVFCKFVVRSVGQGQKQHARIVRVAGWRRY